MSRCVSFVNDRNIKLPARANGVSGKIVLRDAFFRLADQQGVLAMRGWRCRAWLAQPRRIRAKQIDGTAAASGTLNYAATRDTTPQRNRPLAVQVEKDQRKGREQPPAILLQAAPTNLAYPKTRFRTRKSYTTFERAPALVRFLRRCTLSMPCFSQAPEMACAILLFPPR
jgi:hypothetical protein